MPYIIDRGKVITVNVDNNYSSKPLYPLHDLSSVFTHWDDKLKRNVATPNELPSVDKNKLK